jgi:decaprenylphospho-beta-D-ribofuranose 2-oxidase
MEISNWGNYPKIDAQIKEIDSLWKVEWKGKPFISRGLGRSYGDASLYRRILSSQKETGILELNPNGSLRVKGGTSIAEILKLIVPKGYFLPVTPGTKFVTIGGAIAADVHGKNHHKEGTIFNFVESLVLWNGQDDPVFCSPEKEAELFNWTCGGMGLTGVILEATIKLRQIETGYINQKVIIGSSLDELLNIFEENKSWDYSVAWLDSLARGKGFGRGLIYLGEHSKKEDHQEQRKSMALNFNPKKKLNIPFFLPRITLNRMSNSFFNKFFFNFSSRRKLIDLDSFFYPLDSISNWNRAYGRSGFLQYQMVIPKDRGLKGLKLILEKLQSEGLSSFLTVLKQFGPGRGFMSFPIQGYTMALDFPASKKNLDKLDKIDDLVHQMEGRIYLAKDSRMKAKYMELGYERLTDFKSFIHEFPFASNLSERLGIT